MAREILVILLGAKGSVVRTLGIAKALKEKYSGRKIVWVTKGENVSVVQACSFVDEVIALDEARIKLPGKRKFDIACNLDVDEHATKLMDKIDAQEKKGFYADGEYAQAYIPEGEYYLNTMFDDELKKSNKKTYQEMIFDSAGLKHDAKKHKLEIRLGKREKEYANKFAKEASLNGKKIIGVHIGSSPRWPSKAWHIERVFEFVKLAKSKGYEVVLFSGGDDAKRKEEIATRLNSEGIKVLWNNPENSDLDFAGLVSLCDVIVCADSFALHLALALNKKVVCLFFCTSPDEIEGYGLLKKVVSKKLYDFFPQRMNEYDEELVKSISADEVMKEVEKAVDINNQKL